MHRDELISRRICHTDPRFPQDQKPSCEYCSGGNQLQMWHTHACLCTHSHSHSHTLPHRCNNMSVQISPGWSHQSDTNPLLFLQPLSLFPSNLRREGTCQRMLSSPANSCRDGGRETEEEQMNTERANKHSNKSIWTGTSHWWELA